MYGIKQTVITGSDFYQKIPTVDCNQILETILFTNTGESILKIVTGDDGELIPFTSLNLKTEVKYKNAILSTNCFDNGEKYSIGQQNNRIEKFQRKMMMSKTAQDDSSVRFIVEG
jgi:hypothetical protein